MKGAERVVRALEGVGIETAFGLPGSQNLALFEALRTSRIRTVVPTHELAASFMANGYARASGRPGVLVTIPGPGFTYALTTAAQMVSAGGSRHALVIGADVMSSIIDYTDRTTCVIFGDGAGAAVVEASGDPDIGIIDFENYIDGSGGESLCMPAGGSLRPASAETVAQRLHYVKQDGQAVFKFAVRNTEEACRRILQRNNLSAENIDLLVSHQANRRIILSAAEKLGVPEEKVVINIERFGNTTAATIPLALSDAVDAKRLRRGDLLLMVSVGAGFTVGSVLLNWGLKE